MTDPFAVVDYSRLIDWEARLERETPFLARVLATAPARRVLDLGCGTGEHARMLASQGFTVVGVDASDAMLARARQHSSEGNPSYVLGDVSDVGSLVSGEFGGAICLGNTLPHVTTAADLDRLVHGLRERLLSGAPLLIQLLNYERIFAKTQRALPTNVMPEGEGDLVLVRLMDPRPDGQVIFTPAVCRYRPEADQPLELLSARSVRLRGWRRPELETALQRGGFASIELYGTIDGGPYAAPESADLILVAR